MIINIGLLIVVIPSLYVMANVLKEDVEKEKRKDVLIDTVFLIVLYITMLICMQNIYDGLHFKELS